MFNYIQNFLGINTTINLRRRSPSEPTSENCRPSINPGYHRSSLSSTASFDLIPSFSSSFVDDSFSALVFVLATNSVFRLEGPGKIGFRFSKSNSVKKVYQISALKDWLLVLRGPLIPTSHVRPRVLDFLQMIMACSILYYLYWLLNHHHYRP